MSSSTIAVRIRSLLEKTPPFSELPLAERESILEEISIEYFRPGEVLLEQGSTAHRALYLIESGLVRLMDIETQRLIDKCSEGDTFGSFGLMKGGAAIYQAKAIEPTVCAVLSSEKFRKLLDQYEPFAAYFEHDIRRYVRHIDREMDVTGAHLLFSRRLNQFTHRELVTCPRSATAEQAARVMSREGVDSILVIDDGKPVGIVTDGDLRSKLVAEGRLPDTPVIDLMTSPVLTVGSEASLFEAMLRMLDRKVDRLLVTDGSEEEMNGPLALLTDRDIAHFRGQDPVATARRIGNASSVTELVTIRSEVSEQLLRLYRQGVQPEMVNGILSVIYDNLVERMIELVEQDLRSRNSETQVELPWVWLRLGSGGRGEMALNSQQHNALVYANPETREEAARAEHWFTLFAEGVNQGLATCGFGLSNIVATSPYWRKPLRYWKQVFRHWIMQADTDVIGPAAIFFDLRGVSGDLSIVRALHQDITDALNVEAMDQQRSFFSLMAESALKHRPPLNFLRRFVVDRSGEHRNTFDIRERGVLPVVDAARVLALECRYLEKTSTFDRLRYVARTVPELTRVVEDALEAYRFLVDFRLEDQLRAFEAGEAIDNRIDPISLPKMHQNLLRNAFTSVVALQDEVARRYDVNRSKRG